jgi:hypothetical protein
MRNGDGGELFWSVVIKTLRSKITNSARDMRKSKQTWTVHLVTDCLERMAHQESETRCSSYNCVLELCESYALYGNC